MADGYPTPTELADMVADSTIEPDDPRAELLISLAFGLVQRHSQQELRYHVDDVVELDGTWTPELWLPQRPVVSVQELSVQAPGVGQSTFIVAAQAYRVYRIGKVKRLQSTVFTDDWPYMWLYGGWGGPDAKVTVTYTHGYQVLPDDLRAIVLGAAARAWSNPTSAIRSESIGSYSVTVADAAIAGVMLTDEEKEIAELYQPWFP